MIQDIADFIVILAFITIFGLLGWYFFDQRISFYEGLAMYLVLQVMINRSREE